MKIQNFLSYIFDRKSVACTRKNCFKRWPLFFFKGKYYIHNRAYYPGVPTYSSSLTQWVQQISMPPSELSAFAMEQVLLLHRYLCSIYILKHRGRTETQGGDLVGNNGTILFLPLCACMQYINRLRRDC